MIRRRASVTARSMSSQGVILLLMEPGPIGFLVFDAKFDGVPHVIVLTLTRVGVSLTWSV